MSDSIKVSTQVLNNTAKTIRELNAKMDEDLRAINTEMNNLESTWKSDASNDIRSAMNALKPRFEKYKEVVNAYASFLDTAAEEYVGTEGVIQMNAQSFK